MKFNQQKNGENFFETGNEYKSTIWLIFSIWNENSRSQFCSSVRQYPLKWNEIQMESIKIFAVFVTYDTESYNAANQFELWEWVLVAQSVGMWNISNY